MPSGPRMLHLQFESKQSRLVAVRGVNEIFQISAVDPLIRLGFGLWGLNDRDVSVKRPYQVALFDDLEALLKVKARGMHISEVENVDFGRVSGVPGNVVFGLASSDRRFHVGTGQYLYLNEWGGPRRETLSEAIRHVLEEHSRPLTLEEIVFHINARLDRKVDRIAVSSRLQSLNAVFNILDRTWLPAAADQDQIDDDDFEVQQAVNPQPSDITAQDFRGVGLRSEL